VASKKLRGATTHGERNGKTDRSVGLTTRLRGAHAWWLIFWKSVQPWADRSASIAILGGLSLTLLLGAVAMAVDLANLYLAQSVDQRVADQSAMAAALAYIQSNGSITTAQNAAASMAVVNGAASSTVTASAVNSPSGDGSTAVMAVVTSSVSLSPFGQVTTASAQNPSGITSVNISASAYAEIHGATPCIIALGSGGVSASGGTGMTASSCTIGSNGSVTATQGGSITAQSINAVGSISANNGGTVKTTPTAGQTFSGSSAQSDPLAASGVFSRLTTVAAMTAPSLPSMGSSPSGGAALTCNGTLTVPAGSYSTISTSYYPTCSTINFTGGGETDIGDSGLALSGSSVTLNFAAGTYKINGINANTTGPVTMNLSGAVVFDIWNGFTLGSGCTVLTVNGTATYHVQGGLTNGSCDTMVFNNSSGSSSSTFYVAGGINISGGTATFPNGSYTITNSTGNGLYLGGGTTASFGNGSFSISGASGGINIQGSAKLTIGSQLNSSSVFQIPSVGSNAYAISTGGGSTLTIGSFANVDINGPVNLTSTLNLGAGTYTVNGAFSACSSGGGSITGIGVSIIASGAFCFGQGFSSVDLTAPVAVASGTQGTAPTVALASKSATATVTAGASSTVVVGAVYFPSAAMQFSGAGNLNGGGGCLQIVASSLTLSGGSGVSTNCSGLGSSAGSAAVSLVQ
jgi:Flp pilus assembly protein TadG